jgi:hypothetical protein
MIYRTIILLVVLCGSDTWCVTLREGHRLRVFESRAMRRIRTSERDEVTGEWKRLCNKELYDLYSSPNIMQVIKSRRMRWAGHVAHVGDRKGAYRVLVGRGERRRPLGRPRCRLEDNIKMDLQALGLGGMEWIDVAQGQVAGTCECSHESLSSTKCGEFDFLMSC